MNEETRKRMSSSKSEHWGTPEDIIEMSERVGGGRIALDPCANLKRPIANISLSPPEYDGLGASWANLAAGGLVFCNPPYGRQTKTWVQKAVIESARGAEIILLTAARTDVSWFHTWILPTAASICFVKGRLKFIDLTDSALLPSDPAFFPSMITYFGPNKVLFDQEFSTIGHIFTP